MDAREIESLSMVSRGFQELRDVNPELAYNVILDILAGINECVPFPSLTPSSIYFTRLITQFRLSLMSNNYILFSLETHKSVNTFKPRKASSPTNGSSAEAK